MICLTEQVLLVGAACPSLLNQLVMRILVPEVLPGVTALGQPSHGLNTSGRDTHSTLNRRQLEEAHGERAQKGLMQFTKDMLEAEVCQNCRAPTLVSVDKEEDSLMCVRACVREWVSE